MVGIIRESVSGASSPGIVPGLASSGVREAGSVRVGKTYKHPRFRVATLNVGSLKGRGPEVVETLTRRHVDLCAIQEHNWRGASARAIKGKDTVYKFFWSGSPEGRGGVGFLLASEWSKHVMEVKRVSDRIIFLRLVIGSKAFTFVSVYAPQSGLNETEKEKFYDTLQFHIANVPASEVLIPLGDWNGHVGTDCSSFADVHGGRGFGTLNNEGERLLEFARANSLLIGNTCFIKRDSHLVTYCSGGNSTQIDYILYRKSFRKAVRDVKVIPGEECALQHRLVVCDFTVHIPASKKRKFTPRLRSWKLRDPEVANKFREAFLLKACSSTVTPPGCSVEDLWSNLKTQLLDSAEEACGFSKNHQWKRETWWWNASVGDAIAKKRSCYKSLKALEQSDASDSEIALAKAKYSEAKRLAKREVWLAKSDAEKTKFSNISPNGSDIYKLAKQMDRENQDVVGEMCIKDDNGELALTDDKKMKAWVEHYDRLLNVEFDWPQDSLPDVPPVEGPPPPVTTKLIKNALKKMKGGKAAGPSGIVAEMLKATGEPGIEQLRALTESVFNNGTIPKDWEESYLINLYKGKGDALVRGNYRGLKLTDQVMKLQERVMVHFIREMVNFDEMQFSFTPGKGTIDALFIVRQMQEKYLAKGEKLYLAFVDLEKAFDRVPRKVLWWAMRSLGVEEWAVRVVQNMYANARSRVRVNGQYSEEFGVGVGVHQGSVLSPVLFIMVLEALSREFRTGCPWELLYADDLIIMALSESELVRKIELWKRGMERKGLRVNMPKTKVMTSGYGLDVLVKSGRYPCAVCLRGVGERNAILCSSCGAWVHGKACSDLTRLPASDPTYVCRRCKGLARPIDGRPFASLAVDGAELEAVGTFCYLGDMLSAAGGCDWAIKTRCKSAWNKFKKLEPILTSRHLSLKTRGRVFSTCVRPVLLYGSETWAPTSVELQRLRRNDRSMIRWISGVRPSDDVPAAELHERLGIREVSEALRTRRLRWYGHVQRAKRTESDSGPNPCIYSVQDDDARSKRRKTWKKCVEDDMKTLGLGRNDHLDRDGWRVKIRSQTAAKPRTLVSLPLGNAREGGPVTRSVTRSLSHLS